MPDSGPNVTFEEWCKDVIIWKAFSIYRQYWDSVKKEIRPSGMRRETKLWMSLRVGTSSLKTILVWQGKMESAGNSSDHRCNTRLSNEAGDETCCSLGVLTHSAFCKPMSVFWSQLPLLITALFSWFTCLFVCSDKPFTDFFVHNVQNCPEGYMKIIWYLCSELKTVNPFLLHFAFCPVHPSPKPKFCVQTHGLLYFSLNFILPFQLELDKVKRHFFSVLFFPVGVQELERDVINSCP